jgi:FAD/FMN-containing dehydrogenase
VWNGLRSLRKDNTGYDLKHLFIGAEGTLGIITAAVLKLFPRPRSTSTACVAITNPDAAVRLLAHIRANCGHALSAFELISRSSLDLVFKHIEDVQEPFMRPYEWYVLIQVSDGIHGAPDGAVRSGLLSFGGEVLEFDIAIGTEGAENWWKLRKNISEAQKREGLSIKHDIAVPVSCVAAFIARADAALHQAFPGIRIVSFGHMGDGNIHYNISMPDAVRNKIFIAQQEDAVNKLVYEVVRELNGSISAEHGVGQLKREIIRDFKDPLELELMRNIKQALDPQGLMNPGKVL